MSGARVDGADVTIQLLRPGRGVVLGPGDEVIERVAGSTQEEVRSRLMAVARARAAEAGRDLTLRAIDADGEETSLLVGRDGSVVSVDATDADRKSSTQRPEHEVGARASGSPRGVPALRKGSTVVSGWVGQEGRRRGVILGVCVALTLALGTSVLVFAGESEDAEPAPLADACLGGADIVAGAREAGALASTSTMSQDGVTVATPEGAATAAAAWARLRSTLPAPAERDAVMASVVAPTATKAARAAIPGTPGWATRLDMDSARWRVVTGDGRTAAGIDLVLTSVGTHNGQEVRPTTFGAHMALVMVDGRWRLNDVGAAKSTPDELASGQKFNTEGC